MSSWRPRRWGQRLGLEGAVVYRVAPGSGADHAGLQGLQEDVRGRLALGDVIVHVDGERIGSSADLILALENKKIGDTVRVGLLRGDRRVEVAVRLGG